MDHLYGLLVMFQGRSPFKKAASERSDLCWDQPELQEKELDSNLVLHEYNQPVCMAKVLQHVEVTGELWIFFEGCYRDGEVTF
jgi:hypothetical protein